VSVDDERAALTSAVETTADLVRRLGEELAAFRRRALQAEARVRQYEEGVDPSSIDARVQALETENAAIRGRLDAATLRTRQMLDRVRFLRQQRDTAGER
jgi:uncharacterized protein involved in exopolysaccharide biosynthesis